MKSKKIVSLICLAQIAAFGFGLSSCAKATDVEYVEFEEGFQSTWHIGEIDFQDLILVVTYKGGQVEKVPATSSMVLPADLYKFYQPGEWDITFQYDNFYITEPFTIVQNEFSNQIRLASETVFYDGKAHGLTLTGPLPEGTSVVFPQGNSFVESSVNPYEVKCVLSKNGYKTKELLGNLKIERSNYSAEKLNAIVFADTEFTYDGTEKALVAENVPQDLIVDYSIGGATGNSRVNAGEYLVTAKFRCLNSNYLDIPSITAKLIINKAEIDTSKLKFEDQNVTYDGQPHQIELVGEDTLPEGVTVTYLDNTGINAGVYNAKVTFSVDNNHVAIEPMMATLTIGKCQLDLSGITYPRTDVVYDGEPKEYAVEGTLPEGVLVSYKYMNSENDILDQVTDPGVYRVQVTFSLDEEHSEDNYEIINVPTNTAIFIIEEE